MDTNSAKDIDEGGTQLRMNEDNEEDNVTVDEDA
jgi:hypothetical protein